MVFIFLMGTSRFGRRGTQSWIDRVRNKPRLNAFLNRHHGKFRAAFHYVEFVTLTILLYWAFVLGRWEWSWLRGAAAYLLSCSYAYLDELHQSKTPGRMFRRIDFIHSLLGATLAIASIYLVIALYA